MSEFLGSEYQKVPGFADATEPSNKILQEKTALEDSGVLALWRRQFVDALMVLHCCHIISNYLAK